jgi:hypothetical protein
MSVATARDVLVVDDELDLPGARRSLTRELR